MKARTWTIGLIVLAVIGGGYLYLRAQSTAQASQQTNYQTATVSTGSISQSVSSTGNVRSSQSAEVDWQTSGQVTSFDLQVGQSVQAGKVMAKLDFNTVSSSVLNAQQTLLDAEKNLQTMQQSTLTISQAEQALANAQDSYKKAQDALSALQGTTNADETTIKQDQADLLIAQNKLDKLQKQLGDLSRLQATTVQRSQKILRLTAAEQNVETAQHNLNWAMGHASSTEISVAEGNLAVAKSQLDDAQRQYDEVKNGIAAQDVAAAQAAVDAAQATVNEINLTAPISGSVTEVDTPPGSIVSAGTAGARIDDLSSYYVDMVVSEVDVNNIKLGQPAQLTFVAIPNKTYNGKVTAIGTVGTSTQGVVNFPVTVQVTDADLMVKPGMSALVSIEIAKDSNVLLVPNQAVHTLGNQQTVTILYQGQLIPVPVTVGISNNTSTEITGGKLQDGDVVVLNSQTSGSGQSAGGPTAGGSRGGGFGRFIP